MNAEQDAKTDLPGCRETSYKVALGSQKAGRLAIILGVVTINPLILGAGFATLGIAFIVKGLTLPKTGSTNTLF